MIQSAVTNCAWDNFDVHNVYFEYPFIQKRKEGGLDTNNILNASAEGCQLQF